MRRFLAILLTSVLLWALVAWINHGISARHVALFAGGLMVTTAALLLPLKSGLSASAAAGLVCDANAPVPFGTFALLFTAAHALIFHFRDRLSTEETAGRVAVAFAANIAFFLAVSLIEAGRAPLLASSWPRLASDLACSQLFVVLVAPWFFSLQSRALALADAGPKRGP